MVRSQPEEPTRKKIMSQTPVLDCQEIRDYLRDSAGNNLLISGEEFSDVIINLAIDLACSEYDMMAPATSTNRYTFPNKSLLLSGTLYKMFSGQCALLARNTMQYSDGGLQIPVEERFQLYQALASMYQESFEKSARSLKTQLNMDEFGWGEVSSDYARFPIW